MRGKTKGFTLIELLVVISIIGLLATIAAVALKNAREDSRNTKRFADLQQISKALEVYYDKNGFYPDINYTNNEFEWNTFVTALAPHMATIPNDPLFNGKYAWVAIPPYTVDVQDYQYQYSSKKSGGTAQYWRLETLSEGLIKNEGWLCSKERRNGMHMITLCGGDMSLGPI